MATATITISVSSTPLTATKTFTGVDADVTALLAWAAVANAGLIQQLFNPSNTPGFVPTNAQIATALLTALMNSWKAGVQNSQFSQAQAAVAVPAQMTFA